ncbi:hypothetical protein [Marinimicrobium locisalis]|uniref:hypothetical protein n=1 Tax=Marinimicrobium locisalis TaxID=546022 RepID=UPI003222143C
MFLGTFKWFLVFWIFLVSSANATSEYWDVPKPEGSGLPLPDTIQIPTSETGLIPISVGSVMFFVPKAYEDDGSVRGGDDDGDGVREGVLAAINREYQGDPVSRKHAFILSKAIGELLSGSYNLPARKRLLGYMDSIDRCINERGGVSGKEFVMRAQLNNSARIRAFLELSYAALKGPNNVPRFFLECK